MTKFNPERIISLSDQFFRETGFAEVGMLHNGSPSNFADFRRRVANSLSLPEDELSLKPENYDYSDLPALFRRLLHTVPNPPEFMVAALDFGDDEKLDVGQLKNLIDRKIGIMPLIYAAHPPKRERQRSSEDIRRCLMDLLGSVRIQKIPPIRRKLDGYEPHPPKAFLLTHE